LRWVHYSRGPWRTDLERTGEVLPCRTATEGEAQGQGARAPTQLKTTLKNLGLYSLGTLVGFIQDTTHNTRRAADSHGRRIGTR